MYKTLYRKWRPKTFEDVIGQDHVTKILKNEVASKRISHAYLFTGSRGTGKTSCAKILAKAINCENPIDGSPCGKCESCQSIENETCLDVAEIDAASNNGVENIRDMREEIVFTPSKCKYRVYIVDEVHMLSPGAFNAFLKTLEEPPKHVVFILATTELQKLPLTIISRCQKFRFYRLSQEAIEKRIKYICHEENIEIEDKAVSAIALAADGAMRDALSILDQCRGSCEKIIDEKSVRNMLGIADSGAVSDLISLMTSHDCPAALEKIDEIYRQSGNMAKLCEEMISNFRDLMISKVSGTSPKEENLSKISEKISLDDVIYSLEALKNAKKSMSTSADKKLEMEMAAVKLCLRFSGEMHSEAKPEKAKKPEAKPTQVTDEDYWQAVLNEMKKDSSLKALYISLKDSKAHKTGNYILIESENTMAFEFLKKAELRASLKSIISKVLGKAYSIGPYNKKKIEEKSSALDDLINSAKTSNIDIVINQEETEK